MVEAHRLSVQPTLLQEVLAEIAWRAVRGYHVLWVVSVSDEDARELASRGFKVEVQDDRSAWITW